MKKIEKQQRRGTDNLTRASKKKVVSHIWNFNLADSEFPAEGRGSEGVGET